MKGIEKSIGSAFTTFVAPRMIVFLISIFNFVWFFSGSSTVHHFGSNKITFCAVCPWYWDWSVTNLPSLSLIAAICLLFFGWKGQLVSMIITGYEIVDGFRWMSAGSGFFVGISERLDIVAASDTINFWELLDLQYLFAFIIFLMAFVYLIKGAVAESDKVKSLG